MTTPAESAAPSRGRGGQPLDPKLGGRIVTATVQLLAERGRLVSMDEVMASAGVGKASIYRRWHTQDALLIDVVATLGVAVVDHGRGPGDLRGDLLRVVLAATTGTAAAAEIALLPEIARSERIRDAYRRGPALRLAEALLLCQMRGTRRGEPLWPSPAPVVAAVRMLQHGALIDRREPTIVSVEDLVEEVALPALTAPVAA